jgi:copper(I)-binding protein
MRRAFLLTSLATLAACHPAPPAYRAGPLTISRVVSPEPVRGGPGGAYFTITNAGPADTLIRVTSAVSDSVSMHRMFDRDGTMLMGPVAEVAIPAGGTVRFAPGHDHVMLEALRRTLVAGDSVPLVLVFRRAGPVPVWARVVAYRDLESALGAR